MTDPFQMDEVATSVGLGDWTRAELEAAVEAYLQMLRLDQAGEPYNKSAIRRMLLAGPISGRTTTEQRMQNISHVLRDMGRPWIPGYKPLGNIGSGTAQILRDIVGRMTSLDAAPLAARPPLEPRTKDRVHPPTGYWVFLRDRQVWDPTEWLASGAPPKRFKVSDHNGFEFQAGDLGILRLAAAGTSRPAAIHALFEVEGPAVFETEPAAGPSGAEAYGLAAWRVPIRVLADLSDAPVPVRDLPDDEAHKVLIKGERTTTVSIPRRAFETVFGRTGLVALTVDEERAAQTDAGVRALERAAATNPQRSERISHVIERGTVGARVKAARGGRCQLCEALGLPGIAFHRHDGTPYSEAHHVQPVAAMLDGSLGAHNIMVLCANHHREVHYGRFHVVSEDAVAWDIQLGDDRFLIPRPSALDLKT